LVLIGAHNLYSGQAVLADTVKLQVTADFSEIPGFIAQQLGRCTAATNLC